MGNDFFSKRLTQNNQKLNHLLKELPLFCGEFFIGIMNNTSILTRVNYAYDLRIFFDYIINRKEIKKPMHALTYDDLKSITTYDIEYFLNYLSSYDFYGTQYCDGEHTKSRKLATIRSLFKYFFNKNILDSNIAAKVNMPKKHDKEIVKLEVDEVSKLLNEVEQGNMLSGRQKAFHERTKLRDTAILTLFLGTGIRISELVSLDIEDIDFKINAFTVTRKGGNRTILYFSEEVSFALLEYLKSREDLETDDKIFEKKPLFLSLQNNRISVRAVENLVKKYSKSVTPLKKITPHKLRSTYGTTLYRETQDIYIVADVLGHKDVNTTKKHYAAISDELRRNVANVVKLREKDDFDTKK